MLVKDEELQRKQRQQDAYQEYQQKVNTWVANELGQGRIVEGPVSVANNLRQVGRPMHFTRLEWVIKQLHPNTTFEDFILRHNLGDGDLMVTVKDARLGRIAWWVKPDNSRERISAYTRAWIPEYSFIKIRDEWVPDPESWGFGTPHIERTKMRGCLGSITVPELAAMLENDGYKKTMRTLEKRLDSNGPKASFKNVKKTWGESIRGWRTVLVCMVQMKLTTPEAIERLVGPGERASWAAHMGRGFTTPF